MHGDELTPWLIRYAYEQGAFPMTMDDGSVEWFQPVRRALFPIEGIHLSKSLERTIRRGVYEVRFDTSFEEVMRGCLRPGDNWISEEFIRAYSEIHRQGWGHCSETWRDGELVGGVYGIALGFQRRVWCPKWTPDSSSSFMLSCAIMPPGCSSERA